MDCGSYDTSPYITFVLSGPVAASSVQPTLTYTIPNAGSWQWEVSNIQSQASAYRTITWLRNGQTLKVRQGINGPSSDTVTSVIGHSTSVDNYLVKIAYNDSCFVTASFFVDATNALDGSITGPSTISSNPYNPPEAFTANLVGGTPPYRYQWQFYLYGASGTYAAMSGTTSQSFSGKYYGNPPGYGASYIGYNYVTDAAGHGVTLSLRGSVQ